MRQIMVKDGDRVVEGQPLVVFDDTDARSELGIVNSVLVENLAKRARLEAQRDNRTTIDFPPELIDPEGRAWRRESDGGPSSICSRRITALSTARSMSSANKSTRLTSRLSAWTPRSRRTNIRST